VVGLTREQAAKAVEDGWSQASLLHLHRHLLAIEREAEYLSPFAFNCQGVMVYKSFTASETVAAFDSVTSSENTAYCDGSGHGTKEKLHPAGIGVVVYSPGEAPRLFAQNIGLGTNNRAELAAAWCALRATPDTSQKLLILTDSEYTIGALTMTWARNVNAGLIGNVRLDLAQRGNNVRFEHVKGHAGHEGNEVADKLANIGRKIVTTVSIYEG
jgi:ribonuclease HI